MRAVSLLLASLALLAGCGAEDDGEPRTEGDKGPRVLTTTTPDTPPTPAEHEAYLERVDRVCKRIRPPFDRLGERDLTPAQTTAAIRRARRGAERAAPGLTREVPVDLEGAQEFADALQRAVRALNDAEATVQNLPGSLSAGASTRRLDRAYEKLNVAGDLLAVPSCGPR